MREKKYRLSFDEKNLHDPVSYTLVSQFNIIPNILQARIDGSGGRLILSVKGKDKDIADAVEYLKNKGIGADLLDECVKKDQNLCIECGSCVSVCPATAIKLQKETWDVTLETDKCIACSLCLSACPTRAISLNMDP